MGTADGADCADGQALAVLVALTQWVSPPNERRIRKFLNPRDLRFFPSPLLGLNQRFLRRPLPPSLECGSVLAHGRFARIAEDWKPPIQPLESKVVDELGIEPRT